MSSSSIQQPCPRCQFPLNLGVSTCPQCGLNLLENAVAPAEVAAFNQPLPSADQHIDAPAIAPEGAEAVVAEGVAFAEAVVRLAGVVAYTHLEQGIRHLTRASMDEPGVLWTQPHPAAFQ